MPRTLVSSPRQLVQGVAFDGVHNYLSLGTMGSFGSNLSAGFYCKFTIQTMTKVNTCYAFGFLNAGTATSIYLDLNDGTTQNRSLFFLRDDGGKVLSGYFSTVINDGAIHTIILTVNPSTNTIVANVDGNNVSVNNTLSQTPVTFSNLGFAMTLGARNTRGTIGGFTSMTPYNFQIGTSAGALYGNYQLQEGSGTTTAEISGQNNTGTLSGNPLPIWNTRSLAGNRFKVVDVSETSLSFNGTSDFATVPVTPDVNGFSVGFWMTVNAAAQLYICWTTANNTDGFNMLTESAGNVNWYSTVNNGASSKFLDLPKPKRVGQWVFIVLTHVQGAQKIYFNGVQADTDTGTMSVATGQSLTLGRRSYVNNLFMNGKMKNFTFQNTTTPWTQAQITALMYQNAIPSGAQQWSLNNTANDTTGANPLTLTGTSYSTDVPPQFTARTLVT